jgi:hypothetical protein
MSDALDRLAAVAASQRDVFTRGQAHEAGLSPSALARHVATHRMQRVGTRTLAFGRFAVPWRSRLQAGLLDLGDGALISGRSASALLGLDGFAEGPLGYLVPRGLRHRRTPGVVSSSPTLCGLDRTVVDGLACTSATRTIISLVGDASRSELERAVQSALRAGLTSVPTLVRRLADLRHGGMEGVGDLDWVLAEGGVESWLERRFLDLVRRAGLPAPALQVRHRIGPACVARVDFGWPDTPMLVEVGGKLGYLTARERQRKERRRNALQLQGKVVYFFSYEDITEDPGLVIATLCELHSRIRAA